MSKSRTGRMPYHRRYHEDALQGFSRLSLEQRGAYQLILDLMYATGGEIDDDDNWLAGQALTTSKKWRRVKGELVAHGKIWIVNGKIGNGRAMAEIEAQERAYRKMVEGGEQGAKRRASDGQTSDATQVQPHMHRSYKSNASQMQTRLDAQKPNENNTPHQGYPTKTLEGRGQATRTNTQNITSSVGDEAARGRPAGGPPPATPMGGGGLGAPSPRKPQPAAPARTPAEQLAALREAAVNETQGLPQGANSPPACGMGSGHPEESRPARANAQERAPVRRTREQKAAAKAATIALLAETLAARTLKPDGPR